jgi:DNA end-binding protein Ku
MRSVWKGAITFGLVHIPVELYSATRGHERISFRMLHKRDHSPIKYERVCQKEGKPVPWSEVVKGYEYEKGKFVVLEDEDFKAAAIQSSKSVEILDFVKADEVDPRYFETPYYLLPAKGGEKPYALLREAIRRTNTVGVGKITMRSNSQHLAGVKVVGDALVLALMRFEGELVAVDQFTFPPSDTVRPQELKMAEQLIENLSDSFDPAKYTDEYHDNLQKIIRAKMKGAKISFDEPAEPEATTVVDLMARLQESLAAGRKKRAPAAKARARSAEKTAKTARPARRKTA